MRYKALFLDLDGTTVPTAATKASQRVVQAVAAADEKLQVCIATGRPLPNALPVIEQLKINGLCVIANGIQIYDPVKQVVVKQIDLDQRKVPQIVNVLQKYSKEVFLFDGKNDLPITDDLANHHVLSVFADKVSAENAQKIADEITKELTDVVVHKMVLSAGGTFAVEVCNVKATKLHAIVHVAEILGIKTHEIIGVGDGDNDFPLLMACGLKVAMGNAVPALKSIADFVAPTVDEDGVATVIEKYILGS